MKSLLTLRYPILRCKSDVAVVTARVSPRRIKATNSPSMCPIFSRPAPGNGASSTGDNVADGLVALFARALRTYEDGGSPSDSPTRRIDVSNELVAHISAFAAQWKDRGRTPEQMLVELKHVLAESAPEVTGSVRAALTASATRTAIDRFFAA
jgi:hypothetical protein